MRRMSRVFLAGAAATLFAACAAMSEPADPTISVGGTSELVPMFERVGAQTNLPPELLAAMSYVQTRFAFANSEEHGTSAIGLLGLSKEDVRAGASLAGITDDAALSDPEASLRASAALVRSHLGGAASLDEILAALEPHLRGEITRVLARGVDSLDDSGARITIAARPRLRDHFATTSQALGPADYAPAKWVAAYSGNYAAGSRGLTGIKQIVIHDVEGSYGSCINWFQDPAAEVSAHYVVRSMDGEITQMVAEKNVAWHDACNNTYTIGIEHEGFLDAPERWFTEAMYVESAKLVAYLTDKYGIAKTRANILGHGEADDCSTHTDPGPGWNWDHYMDLIATGGAPHFDAQDVTIDAPESLTSGETGTVTIHIKNNGNAAWDLDLTRLGTAAPQDRQSELFVDGDWIDPTRPTATDAHVEPGETGTFTFEVLAPSVREATMFDEGFQLVQENSTWFGPEMHVVLNVVPGEEDTGCNASGSSSWLLGFAFVPLVGRLGRRRRR
jgi:hypothetical protein